MTYCWLPRTPEGQINVLQIQVENLIELKKEYDKEVGNGKKRVLKQILNTITAMEDWGNA